MKQSISPAFAILSKKTWRTANGVDLDPMTEMEESHIRNTLHFIYVKRAFFLMQSPPEVIQAYNPDEFFTNVIKNSTLWLSLLEALDQPTNQEALFYESLERVGDFHE